MFSYSARPGTRYTPQTVSIRNTPAELLSPEDRMRELKRVVREMQKEGLLECTDPASLIDPPAIPPAIQSRIEGSNNSRMFKATRRAS